MNTRQFFHTLRSYAELSRRMKRSYGEQVDQAAALHVEWLASQKVDQSAKIAKVDATVAREYDPLYRSYPLP